MRRHPTEQENGTPEDRSRGKSEGKLRPQKRPAVAAIDPPPVILGARHDPVRARRIIVVADTGPATDVVVFDIHIMVDVGVVV